MQLDGVLFFPVTPFARDGGLNVAALRAHVEYGLSKGPGAIFVACGTGEFHALDPDEYAVVVQTAVDIAAGEVPVFAGTGSALPLACRFSAIAEAAGVDGLLLLPPYLVTAPSAGLVAYTRAVAQSTNLPLIVYNRGNAVFDPASAVEISQIPNVTGFKDGVGDLDLLARIMLAVRAALGDSGKQFQFFNGMPTAEVTVPAYRGVGVELYSSAVFCFAPEVSTAFFDAVNAGDNELAELFLNEFFHPLVTLRDRVPGYAISLVKAAVGLRGIDAGGVRPPLVDPSPEHLAELQVILDAGLAVAAGAATRPTGST